MTSRRPPPPPPPERGAGRVCSRTGCGRAGREHLRTCNFPQDRVTDHRLERNFHNLPTFMDGEIDAMVQALRQQHQAELLEQAGARN